MRIQFRQSIASDTGSFALGQIVAVPRLPRGWEQWLQQGVIRLLRDPADESAVTPQEPEKAVVEARRGRRRGRRSPLAE